MVWKYLVKFCPWLILCVYCILSCAKSVPRNIINRYRNSPFYFPSISGNFECLKEWAAARVLPPFRPRSQTAPTMHYSSLHIWLLYYTYILYIYPRIWCVPSGALCVHQIAMRCTALTAQHYPSYTTAQSSSVHAVQCSALNCSALHCTALPWTVVQCSGHPVIPVQCFTVQLAPDLEGNLLDKIY